LQPVVNQQDTLNYNKKRSIAESFKIRKVDSLLFRFDLSIAEKVKDWKKYTNVANQSVEKFGYKNSNLLVEIGNNYLNNILDKNEIEKSILWLQQAIILGESLDKYILISKLYSKINNTKLALEYAEKGKKMATNYGWNTSQIDQLIDTLNKH
jgi:hypothetical protein